MTYNDYIITREKILKEQEAKLIELQARCSHSKGRGWLQFGNKDYLICLVCKIRLKERYTKDILF